MTLDNVSASLKTLLDDAIADGAAAGLVACAFTRDGTFASAASGVSAVESKAPMTLDTTVWLASASKPVVSLAALSIIEKEGFDLDSHEELVKVIPELGKDWPETKLWTLFDGKDDNGEWKFKQARKGITLRHLLTHTSGLAYNFTSEEVAWLLGSLKSCIIPRLFEAGERYQYGSSGGFLALFIIRKTGKNLRQAMHDLVLSPLGCKPNTVDAFITPAMRSHLAAVDTRNPVDGSFAALPSAFEIPQWEGEPPEGFLHVADAPLYGKVPAYAEVLRAILVNGGSAPASILSPEMWKKATDDDLKLRGLSTSQKPFLCSSNGFLSNTVEQWVQPKEAGVESELGWSMLQTLVHRQETKSGLKPGTLEWAGIANTFFFVDPSTGVGGVISAQYLPASNAMLEVRDKFHRWVIQVGAFLFGFVELCERFSYYGCSNIFTNFIQRGLPEGSTTGSYTDGQRGGALGLGQQASTGLTTFNQFWVYCCPLFGAWLADTYLGKFKTMSFAVGIALICHVLLVASAAPSVIQNPNSAVGAFAVAIIIMGLGTGMFKSTISPLVAEQVASHRMFVKTTKKGERVIVDPAAAAARMYNWYYMCVNVGALAGQLSMAYTERDYGFWLAFLLPTVIFALCPIVLVIGRKRYVHTPPAGESVHTKAFRTLWVCFKKAGFSPKKWYATSFWQPAYEMAELPAAEKPKCANWDAQWVSEVRHGFKACQVFAYLPLYWLCYNQINNNLVSPAAVLNVHGLPSDVLANLDPYVLLQPPRGKTS
ncbi:hypothetical protein JCM10207_004596 [Rhodosporidiobolus poonsookiae]